MSASATPASRFEEAAMAAVDRTSSSFLVRAFDKYRKPASEGITSASDFRSALVGVGAPCVPHEHNVQDFFKRYDTMNDRCVSFDAFKRAVEAPDLLQTWLDEGSFKLGALAPALRLAMSALGHSESATKCSNEDFFVSLKAMSVLDQITLDVVVDASVAALKKRLKEKQSELQQIFQAQERAIKLETDKSTEDRLVIAKMSAGSVGDFFRGLTGRVGFPSLDFERAIFLEHCQQECASFQFSTGNPYHITTNPSIEWKYVVHAHVPDANGQTYTPPQVILDGKLVSRVIGHIDLLVAQYQHAELSRPEVIAIILYSGPMFIIYNGILRQFPKNIFGVFQEAQNLFPTTIFVLASALQKLARKSPISSDTPLYRGLGGAGKFTLELPDSFHEPDADFCTGYMDFGFQSFTADKGTALTYSGVYQHKPGACALEIRPNSIDRAADISSFSQFPKEKEYTFVPCSFVQRARSNELEVVHWTSASGQQVGVLSIIPACVNANLRTETIEQLRGKKKKNAPCCV
jgi:hypothetical protein